MENKHEIDALLYAAFGSTETRTMDWGGFPPAGDYDIECEYFESEESLEASMSWSEWLLGA